MRWAVQSALAGFFIAGTAIQALAAAPGDGVNAKQQPPSNRSIDGVMGKKFVSIDGSLITLNAAEGGLARDIVAPNGVVQRTTLRFITDRLGTVLDAQESGKATGVFRIGPNDINIQYADGGSEALFVNGAGGISIEVTAPPNTSYCSTWYPQGHVFSMDERKMALAQYASRLGLGDGSENRNDLIVRAGCGTVSSPEAKAETKSDTTKPQIAAGSVAAAGGVIAVAKNAPTTAAVAARLAGPETAGRANPGKTGAPASSLTAVNVRNSEVHAIDNPATPAAEKDTDAQQSPTGLSSGPRGASSCLSIETDAGRWGFRNRCDYAVRYAYCDIGNSQVGSCDDGAVSGSVGPRGFGVLPVDSKDGNGAHDFRWVACQGGTGEVVARLDHTNPPSGRCVR